MTVKWQSLYIDDFFGIQEEGKEQTTPKAKEETKEPLPNADSQTKVTFSNKIEEVKCSKKLAERSKHRLLYFILRHAAEQVLV